MGCRLAEGWPHLGSRPNLTKKVGLIDERSLEKSKEHHARVSAEAASFAKIIKFCRSRIHQRIWNSQNSSPALAHGLQLGTPLPHAPGARMTVVYTNSLKLTTRESSSQHGVPHSIVDGKKLGLRCSKALLMFSSAFLDYEDLENEPEVQGVILVEFGPKRSHLDPVQVHLYNLW